MVKLLLVILLAISLYSDIYKKDCVLCHKNSFQMHTFMKKYTLKYSSEDKIKKAIFKFLKVPSQQKSIMPFNFIRRWGLKEQSTLSDKELQNAIDIYYQKYNMKQYLR
jgi:hypothetical protein